LTKQQKAMGAGAQECAAITSQSGFYWSKKQWVAASSISWAICKSASRPRFPRQHPATQFFTGQIPFPACSSTNSVKAL